MTTVNVLLVKDEVWCAQCLEHDIAAQGETVDQAMMELTKMLAAEAALQQEMGSSLDAIPAAPAWYWKKFNEAVQVKPKRFVSMPEMDVPPAFMLPELREIRVA